MVVVRSSAPKSIAADGCFDFLPQFSKVWPPDGSRGLSQNRGDVPRDRRRLAGAAARVPGGGFHGHVEPAGGGRCVSRAGVHANAADGGRGGAARRLARPGAVRAGDHHRLFGRTADVADVQRASRSAIPSFFWSPFPTGFSCRCRLPRRSTATPASAPCCCATSARNWSCGRSASGFCTVQSGRRRKIS